MLAYFHKGEFVAMWQDQSNDPTWFDRTIKAMGHQKSDVEVYECPAVRSDLNFSFDANKNLVVELRADRYPEDATPGVILYEDPVALTRKF